jgi:polysaccharide deacetylase 2 family uncharacterized protein YibQ
MAAIDREAVLDAHNYPERGAIKSRMDQAEQAAAQAGSAPKPGPGKRVRAGRQT